MRGEAFNEAAFLGLGEARQLAPPSYSPFYPGDDHVAKYTEYDPEGASKILDEIGLDQKNEEGFRLRPDGEVLDLTLLAVVREMVAFYYDTYKAEESKPLLTGSDVMTLFGMPQGALIGRVLDEVVRAEEEGAVGNREEAVRHIREWLSSEGRCR